MTAFANTDGGRLLVGIKDNGSIAGVRSDEEYYMIEAAAQVYSKPEVPFQHADWNVEGKTVLEIIIPKSHEPPHFVNESNGRQLAYVRVGDQNLLANTIMLKVWKRRNEKAVGTFIRFTELEKTLLEYLDQHMEITLSGFCRIAGIPRFQAENILVNFILLDIVRIIITEKLIYYKLNEDFDKASFDM